MEFIIPLCRDDLLRQKSANEYYVREPYDQAEISDRLPDFENAVEDNGSIELQQNFDLFFSAIKLFNQIDIELRARIWNNLLHCLNLHYNELCEFLLNELNNENRNGLIDNRRDHRNTLQMNIYLLCQMAECFENQIVHEDQQHVSFVKGKRGRKQTISVRAVSDSQDLAVEWTDQKCRLLQSFVQLVQLPLNLLWDPPIVDEQFVNCMGNICFKIFENPETKKSRLNNEDAFDLLGVLIKSYRHHSAVGIKIVQQLQHFEHLSSVWAQAVAKFVSNFHAQNVVLEIFRELSSVELDDLTKEGASARNYANFLIELTEKCPPVVLANVSLLMCHLEAECYTMRNAVLTLLGELIIRKLQGEQLGENERQNRDKFLDRLEVHLHDKNAFVRSKCMQIWNKMCEQNCIPKSRLKSLLPLIIGRLVDKGSTVRKGAIQLLTTILRNNPYMAKLSLEEMQQKYTIEKNKLITMVRDKEPKDQESKEREIIRNADLKWSKLVESLDEVVDTWIGSHFQDGYGLNNSTVVDEAMDCDIILKAVFNMLIEGNYAQACGFTALARQTWPEHRVFQSQLESSQDVLPSSLEDAKRKLLDNMKNIYLEHLVAQDLAQLKRPGDSSFVEGDVEEFDDDEDDDEDEEDKQTDNDTTEIQQQRRLVRYLRDSKIFAEQLQAVLPQVSMMLRQTQTSDVLESIEFVVTCAEFGVTGAKASVWKCCSLIWSKDAQIKEAVVKAFQRLYLLPNDEANTKNKHMTIAQNLIDLVVDANLSQRTSLEDVICEVIKHKLIRAEVLQILWEKFAGKNGTTQSDSKAALKILGMAAKAEKSIVKENFDFLVQYGLGEKARKDFEFAHDTCVALEKLGRFDKRKDEEIIKQEPYRLPENSVVFSKLQNLIVTGFTCTDDIHWTPMMERALKVIFLLSEHPDKICGEILIAVYSEFAKNSQISVALLTRFISLIGQSALQTFIFVDVAVCRELKRRNLLREEAKTSSHNKKKDRKSIIATPRSTVSKTILGKLSKIVLEVCKHHTKYNNPDLQAAAALALAKIMIVSSKFCEAHLPLLFTLLERSQLSSVRANIVIAIGDLSYRFPNLIEPWSVNVYKRLNDNELNVRLNCLLILNHLILNDMVKPKGHVADIALCTLDKSTQVASLAKKFFVEYSEKGNNNALYNLLPDIISRLSDSENKVESEDFKTVMKFLFTLITKERQFESLIEKLCQRFQGTRSVEQWRFFSFCLSLPPYNDKCLKKLNENFSCFVAQLGDKDVFNNFMSIINASKKSTKVESKNFVEELEDKLLKAHSKQFEDDELSAKVVGVKDVPDSARKTKKPKPFVKKFIGDSENEETEGGDTGINNSSSSSRHPPSSARKMRKMKSVAKKLSSDSEEESISKNGTPANNAIEASSPTSSAAVRSTRSTRSKRQL